MIVEIALGIVLATVILAFLPLILVFGVYALGVVVVLAVAGGAIWFFYTEPGTALTIVGMASLLWAAFYWDAKREEKKRELEKQQREAQEEKQREESEKRLCETLKIQQSEAQEYMKKKRREASEKWLCETRAKREKAQEEWEKRWQQYE